MNFVKILFNVGVIVTTTFILYYIGFIAYLKFNLQSFPKINWLVHEDLKHWRSLAINLIGVAIWTSLIAIASGFFLKFKENPKRLSSLELIFVISLMVEIIVIFDIGGVYSLLLE